MNIEVSKRIWEHATHRRGTRKLLLLALANHADYLGICWPNVPTLAALLSEDPDYVRKITKDAEAEGDIVRQPGKGRGNPTIYGVAIGLSPDQAQRLAIIVSHTAIKKNVRYLRIDGRLTKYAPGLEAELFGAAITTAEDEKEVLQPPLSLPTVDKFTPTVEKSRRPARRPAADPPHVSWLKQNEQIFAADIVRNCDPEATIEDYKNRRAAGWPKGAIIDWWKATPPTKENIFHADDTTPADRPTAKPAAERKQRSRVGGADYYD